eukprot:6185309-Pleurochrysis_carterae.AAC.1
MPGHPQAHVTMHPPKAQQTRTKAYADTTGHVRLDLGTWRALTEHPVYCSALTAPMLANVV